jgi:hypothetical protein
MEKNSIWQLWIVSAVTGETFRNNVDHGIADPRAGFVPGRRESKKLSPEAVDNIRQ